MTALAIFSDTATDPERTVTDFPKLAETLAEVGVLLERRRADQFIDSTTPNDVVMDIYRESVDRMKQRHGCSSRSTSLVSSPTILRSLSYVRSSWMSIGMRTSRGVSS
jgi:cupin superfamily acireductone dioxygenase involved in methionine salvage